MKRFLLFIAIIISSVGLFAQSVGDNTIIDYEGYSLKFTVTNLEPAECEIKCSTKPTSSTEIVIPSSVTIEGMEFSVTSIGNSAFSHCSNLTSIEIPNSVTSIGERAFYACSNLTSIEIPNSVTSIGIYAFRDCESLTSIYCYAENVPETSSSAFNNCPSDMVIYVPAQSVDAYKAASPWNNYTILALGDESEEEIGVNIGDYTIIDYEGYSLKFTVTNLEPAECAVSGYEGEPVDVTIPSTATISGMEFSVTSIGNYAFYSCISLTSIAFPNSIESIGDYVINSCPNIESVEIPSSLIEIGNYNFIVCPNLKSIKVDASNPVYDSRNNCNAIIETETNTLIAGCNNTIIPNTVTIIGRGAFFGSSLEYIEIPNNVVSISEAAFRNCASLNGVVFEENSNLKRIESYNASYGGAFADCVSLTSIEIPSSVTYIGNGTFSLCSNLTNVIFEEGSKLDTIGNLAFRECSNLTSIYCYAENVPETVSSAFNSCPSNMVIYVPAQSVDAYKAASPWNEYTIMAMEEPQFATEFFYDFNDGSLDGWRTFQDDNDNNNWMLNNNQGIDNSYCIYSYSYKNGIIFPDNYIVTTSKYSITETSTLTFASHPGVNGYFEDNYGVVVSEDNENWTVVWSEKFEEYYNEYTYKTVNLSAYAGKNIYIGFRHYDTDGNVAEYVLIDNVKLSDNSKYWKPDGSLYANNMSVIGLIQIDGVNQNSTSLEIGAFCGEEVRGSQIIQYIPALDKYLVFLTIHGEGSEEISFKLYDHSIGEELDLRSPEAITFAVNGTLGSIANPYVLNFNNMVEITAVVNPSEAGYVTGTGIYAIHDIVTLTTTPYEGFSFKNWTVNGEVVSTDMEYSFVVTEAVELVANYNYVHTRDLKSGWSWFSTFIEMEGENGLEMMTNAFGTNGSQIKNQTEFVVYSDGEWYGSLMSANTDVMYMLEASAPHSFTLFGAKVNPEELPISIGTNWRWISYPLNISLSVEDALSTIVSQTGDYIKSKTAFSQYYEGIGWIGALNTMNPGEGYMYQNVSGTTKTLVYPSESATRSMKANVTAENNYWIPEAGKFATNMSVIAVVENNITTDYEVAAFVGDEIRGSARPIYIEALDRHMIFMTVYGNSNERIEFKYYDVNADAVENVSSKETIIFADNATYGSVDNAIVLTCGTTGINENGSELLNVYPNPANVNAEISLGMTYDRVEVYNAIGVKVAEYADVDRIGGIETAGVYVIKVTNDAEARNCRIVVR